MAAGCGGTCEPAPQTRGFPRGMAAGCGGTCEPAPQTRGLPRGMAAGWWGLGRGGGGPRGGFGHLGEGDGAVRSEEHTSELQSLMAHLVCRLLLEKKKKR